MHNSIDEAEVLLQASRAWQGVRKSPQTLPQCAAVQKESRLALAGIADGTAGVGRRTSARLCCSASCSRRASSSLVQGPRLMPGRRRLAHCARHSTPLRPGTRSCAARSHCSSPKAKISASTPAAAACTACNQHPFLHPGDSARPLPLTPSLPYDPLHGHRISTACSHCSSPNARISASTPASPSGTGYGGTR